MQPVKIKWIGQPYMLGDGVLLRPGEEGVLVAPNTAAWPEVTSQLYTLPPQEGLYTVVAGGLGGWDGTTVTPELIRAVLAHPNAISTLVQILQDDPELGPKIIQGVMAGL